ncbi:chorismate mutase [Asticcacaulis sp. BYS171W]|uniref:chorismate mutase n=1 Tax=Asticcacaulis aquaticus TaxID=2984212 RepID=A0ABT5HSK1_9CAUL|nr:chorismate mutase [Asticcacaulis aquaticus]MDC7682820.1 chorismate mutase [Asticcacaulis aquaticus]
MTARAQTKAKPQTSIEVKAETLQSLRLKIDALDTDLLRLIDERSALARDIAAAKIREGVAGQSVSLLRPDREALLLRKLTDAPRKAASDAAVIAIWRELISESLRIQGEDQGGLHLNFWAGDKPAEIFQWGRERFGAAPTQGPLAEPLHVIAAARDPQNIGIISLETRAGAWWARLLAEPAVRVICALPERNPDRPKAFAIAALTPEPTGDDVSYWVTDSRLSESALIEELGHRGLAAEWLYNVGGMKLFALSGFVQAHDGRLDPASGKVLGGLSGIIGTSARI